MSVTTRPDVAVPTRLTVFTPTFNRAHTLPRLYASLCEQEWRGFLWLIVDDGSTDGTAALVEGWQQEGRIEIEYHLQANGGKMRAHNRGVALCHTELFVCIDSDDYLSSPSALGDNIRFWDLHAAQAARKDVCGLLSLRKGEGLKQEVPQGLPTITLSDLNASGYEGETTLIFKTGVLRHFPFPEIEGEKFITENIVYDLIDRDYCYLLFPYFTQVCQYREDGYTRNAMQVLQQNPRGYSMYYNQLAALHRRNPFYNIKMYIATSLLAGHRDSVLHTLARLTTSASRKLLTLLLLPMGWLQYRRLRKGRW